MGLVKSVIAVPYVLNNDSFNLFSVPVVQKTVGQYAKHIVYYSETKDSSIPTEDIGVPNTESGRSEDLEEGSRALKQRQVRLSPFVYTMVLPKLYNLHSCRADLAENLGKIVAQECKSRSTCVACRSETNNSVSYIKMA